MNKEGTKIKKEYCDDDIHPNRTGYEAMTEKIEFVLHDLLMVY